MQNLIIKIITVATARTVPKDGMRENNQEMMLSHQRSLFE